MAWIQSVPRKINGGGPQGATLGILEYLSQSNTSADCVDKDDRFKFIDDLSILEIVNLLTVGITSFNIKMQIPTDIPDHNQYIPAQNLESQKWLDTINTYYRNFEFLNFMFANVMDLEMKWLVGTVVSYIGSPDWTFIVTVQSKSKFKETKTCTYN